MKFLSKFMNYTIHHVYILRTEHYGWFLKILFPSRHFLLSERRWRYRSKLHLCFIHHHQYYSILPWLAINIQGKVRVVINEEFVLVVFATRRKITERYSRFCVGWFHPETDGELSQTGRAFDLGVISRALVWEVKSVICTKTKTRYR